MHALVRLVAICSTAITALAVTSGALAQPASPPSGPAGTAARPSGQLEEIVVTAQRRRESTQKASVEVQVLARQQLEQVANLGTLTAVVPGVQVGQVGNFDSPYIRGVGTTVTNGRADSPIATNLDGVVVTQGAASSPFFFDLSRVEVLLGPQGTLYGRNATGGAVNVITTAPVFGKYSADASAEFGNYGLVHLTGGVNVPIAPNLAVRGSFQVDQHNGYVNDGSNDNDTDAGRLRVRWQPDDDINLNLTGEYGHVGGHGDGIVLKPAPDGDSPWATNAGLIVAYPPYYQVPNPGAAFSRDRFVDNGVWNLRGDFDWNLGFATLTVIPGYSDQGFSEITDATNFRYYEDEKNQQSTIEVRLAHDTPLVKWVVGAYGYDFDQRLLQGLQQCIVPSCNSGQIYHQTNESEAAFGQINFTVAEGLRVIGGVRYTHETITGNITPFVNGNPPLVPFPPNVTGIEDNPLAYDAFNWRTGWEYDVAPRSMAYFTASTGFKAGGVESITTGTQDYLPEKLTAFDLGIKNQFFQNRLRLNFEAFDWEYTNQQFGRLTLDPSGFPDFLTANAGAATIRGANVDATWKITDIDQVHLITEYTHGKYDSFKLPEVSFGGPPLAALECPYTQTSPINYIVDCSGKNMPRLPAWSGSVSYQHRFEFANDAAITFDADLQAASSRWLSIDYIPDELAPGYITGDASLTYTPPAEHWSIGIWIRNIADAAIYTQGQALTERLVTASIEPPRTFGFRLSASY